MQRRDVSKQNWVWGLQSAGTAQVEFSVPIDSEVEGLVSKV